MAMYNDPTLQRCACGESGKITHYGDKWYQSVCASIANMSSCRRNGDTMPTFKTEKEARDFWNREGCKKSYQKILFPELGKEGKKGT